MLYKDKLLMILNDVRNQINIYLGKQPHIACEKTGTFIYRNDASNRLTKLQAIVGYSIDETVSDNLLNLVHLFKEDKKDVKKNDLVLFINQLEVLKPVKHCRFKAGLTNLIEKVTGQLTEACALIEKQEAQTLSSSIARVYINRTSVTQTQTRAGVVQIGTSESFFATSLTTFKRIPSINVEEEKKSNEVKKTTNPTRKSIPYIGF